MKSLFVAISLLVTSTAQAGLTASVGVMSDYYWRGLVVEGASVQPELSLDITDNLSVSALGAFNVINRNKWEAADEVDFTLTYTVENDTFNTEVGLTQYVLPNAPVVAVVTETFVAVALTELPLTPSVVNYLTVAGDYWWYVDASVSTGLDFLSLEAHFAVDIRGKAAVKPSDAWGSLSYAFAVGDWGVTPSVNYGYTIANRKVASNDGQEHTFWLGVLVE